MELTSDMEQRVDGSDDIDIDFDLTEDKSPDGEDDPMGEEDANIAVTDSVSSGGQNISAANDDEMADGSYAQGPDDDEVSVRDENIEDALYVAPDPDEDTIVGPDTDQPNEQHEELLESYEEMVGAQIHEQDHHEQGPIEQNHPSTSQTQPGLNAAELPTEEIERGSVSDDFAELATRETSEGPRSKIPRYFATDQGAVDHFAQPPDTEGILAPEVKLEQTNAQVPSVSLGEQVADHPSTGGTHSQEDDRLDRPAHLHPIVVDYQGDEMFLFPPVNQSGEDAATFLLADEQLAYSPIGDLLEACRYVLKGSLSEQADLVINITDLDLHIREVNLGHPSDRSWAYSCEQSTLECENIRLSDVADIYFRLQENDGLENPPPMYIDLTTTDKLSHCLGVLRKASNEGTGLSQLNLYHKADVYPQSRTDGEPDPSNYITAVPSSNETPAFGQEPKEGELNLDPYDSRGQPLPSEILVLDTGSFARGTTSDDGKDVTHEEQGRLDHPRDEGSVPGARGGDNDSSDAATSKGSLERAPPSVGDPESRTRDGFVVDDGDFIDYEDVEVANGGLSSASSTLQGDPIDVHLTQDHATANPPGVAQDQDHQRAPNSRGGFVAEGKPLYEYESEYDRNAVDDLVKEEQLDVTEIPTRDPDGTGQVDSRISNEGETASEKDEDVSPTQDMGPHQKGNVEDQSEVSARYENDEETFLREKLHGLVDQTEGDIYPVPDLPSTDALQSESNDSGRASHDDDLENSKDLEAEHGPEEVARLLTHGDNDHVPHSPEPAIVRPSFSLEESTQAQEDDEITYDDEEYDIDSPYEAARTDPNIAADTGSFKRTRGPHEDDDPLEEDLQGRADLWTSLSKMTQLTAFNSY